MRQSLRILITLGMVAAALAAGVWVWNYYLYSAWTRDGRIRAEIVTIAPDVSGWVTELNVRDNETVQQGRVLFTIDATRYRAAVAQAAAQLAHEKHARALSKARYRRLRQRRDSRDVSAEDLETARINSKLAEADVQLARARLETRKIDLRRTTIRAPATGSIVNLNLRPGTYIDRGTPMLSLVRAGSFYATGYFEETKLPQVHIGQSAKVRLMAGGPVLTGHVVSIAEGIANANTTADSQLLPQVQPVFSWVRLAQRIPVDIALDPIPEGVRLSAGMTATITLTETGTDAGDSP